MARTSKTPGKKNTDLEEARTRLANAQAEKYELRNAQTKKEIIPVKEVNARYAKIVMNIKTKLLALPVKLTPKVYRQEPAETERILTESIYEVLKEFADERLM